MIKKIIVRAFLSLFTLACGQTAWSQIDFPPAEKGASFPKYPVPYEVPAASAVKEVVDRIHKRMVRNADFNLIDASNGQKIKGFSKANKNAIFPETAAQFIEWSYPNGVSLTALYDLTNVTGDTAYLNHANRFFSFTFKAMPYFREMKAKGVVSKHPYEKMINMQALDHCGAITAALIKIQRSNPDPRYRAWIDTVDNYISNKQYRLSDKTIARERPQPESLWGDDLYMCIPFFAQMGKLTGQNKYYDEAVRQVIQLSARLFDVNTGLYDHGWNVNSSAYDPQVFWARANGWCTMAMAELLDVLPQNYEGRDKVLHLYRKHIQSLSKLQDGTGLWHNVLDRDETFLETSASAMFVYSIAKGINEGWISHVYGPVAVTGWNALATKVTPTGEVCDIVEGTTFAHDNTYYFYRGTSCNTSFYGAALRAGSEMIRLLNNSKFEIIAPKPNTVNSAMHFRLKSDKPPR